ncbi:MAG: hypothetical protein RL238_2838 [Actinomycetota bacterium]
MTELKAGTQRACLWCGRTPLTREHLVPQWLLSVLMEVSPNHDGYDTGWEYLSIAGDDTSRVFEQAEPGVVVRAVCEPCNTGWMAQLEGDCQAVLGPLVRGERTTLSVSDQLTLARWIAKTAALMSRFKPGSFVLSDDDLSHIMNEGTAPLGFHTRLAFRDDAVRTPTNFYVASFYAVAASGDVISDPGEPNGFAVTLGLGHFAACVYGGEAFNRPERWREGGDSPLMVWPPTREGIQWPPSYPVLADSDALRAFHEGIFVGVQSPFRPPNASAAIEDARTTEGG